MLHLKVIQQLPYIYIPSPFHIKGDIRNLFYTFTNTSVTSIQEVRLCKSCPFEQTTRARARAKMEHPAKSERREESVTCAVVTGSPAM